MSDKKILLEGDDDDDDNALMMFGEGDDDDEEEEEDVDMTNNTMPPVKKEVDEAETPIDENDGKMKTIMNGDAPESVVDAAATTTTATAPTTATATTTTPNLHHHHHHLLPTSLPSISPFPHHNIGPTSDRLRNAMSRIAISPNKDAEAWQALITEAQSCYRSILPSLDKLLKKNYTNATTTNNVDDSLEIELLEKKLDWIESCYGALLHHFPYAISHYVQLVEIFLRLSAVTVEEEEQFGGGSIGSTSALGGGSGGMMMMASMLGGSGASAAGGVVGVGGAAGGGGGGSSSAALPSSLLFNPMLTTTDMGVSITPASLMMTSHMAQSGTDRQKMYDAKLDRIFKLCLGANTLDNITSSTGGAAGAAAGADITNATTIDGARSITGGLAPHSIDLWLLYIRKVTRDASRSTSISVPIPSPPPGYIPNAIQQGSVLHQQYDETLKSAYRERKDKLRECITKAYELALEKGAGFAQNNHLIWKRYVNYVKSWTDSTNYSQLAPPPPPLGTSSFIPPPPPPPDPAHDHTSSQKQLHLLRSIYQRGITHPMTGLDQFWQEYEAFERSHSESLGSVLIAEWLPRYQHARSIYLERNRVWNARELMMGRLAVPPVGYSEGDGLGRGGATVSSSGVGGSGGGGTGVGGSGGGGGTTSVDADDDFVTDSSGAGGGGKLTSSDATEYSAQIEEELRTLSKWRRRAAYERTNPERLNSSDFAMRVRSSYVEEVCAFARHPEVWYEWSQWELLHGGSTAATSAASNAMAPAKTVGGSGGEGKVGVGNALRAVAVLSLGMESLPDCALLALAQAEILERHFCGTTTLSEKHGKGESSDGMGECIEVLERLVHRSPTTLGFVLLQRLVRRHRGINAARDVFARARRTLRVRDEDMSFDNETEASAVSSEKKDDGLGLSDAKEVADGVGRGVASVQQRMVTNRLKATVGINEHSSSEVDKVQSTPSTNAGFITWHLYTAHATIEHRLGKNPKVAARIFELGLRKHRTFLSNPPYVLYYANLLLELNDEENLRSLLMRAVAACEEMDAVTSTGVGGSDAAVARKREMQRPLWDMMLKFESILSSRNKGNISTDISSIEARRRRALYGPSNEDVVMGGEGSPDDEEDRNLGTGLHKSSLNEQLIRVEGYDVASRIANGMGRLVDVLTVTGAIGNGEFDGTSKSLDFAAAATASLAAGGTASDLWGDDCAGGLSDICYIKRLRFQRDSRTRAAALALGFAGSNQGITSGKLLSRERTAGAAGQAAANPLALQNSPEWLRPLLLLLIPVPKFGKGTVKPPPHLTELALSTLRANSLPANRPIEISNGNTQKKRERDAGDSSDDDEDINTGGGYSHQFRSRQRLRLANAAN